MEVDTKWKMEADTKMTFPCAKVCILTQIKQSYWVFIQTDDLQQKFPAGREYTVYTKTKAASLKARGVACQ